MGIERSTEELVKYAYNTLSLSLTNSTNHNIDEI
jgi:hypothetical protein